MLCWKEMNLNHINFCHTHYALHRVYTIHNSPCLICLSGTFIYANKYTSAGLLWSNHVIRSKMKPIHYISSLLLKFSERIENIIRRFPNITHWVYFPFAIYGKSPDNWVKIAKITNLGQNQEHLNTQINGHRSGWGNIGVIT